MSVKVQTMVFEADLKSATRKVLMLCLADKANADGTGVWPSQRTIARETHLDRKTIRTLLGQLVDEGLLVEKGSSPHRTQIYDISLQKLRRALHVDMRGENSPIENEMGENSSEMGESRTLDGGMAVPKPSRTIINLARTRASPEIGSRLSELLGSHCKDNPVLENALITLSAEAEAFDGRRILIQSRFMADRVTEALRHILKAENLIVTTNPADMQLEEVTK
jgi:hypothetical protein